MKIIKTRKRTEIEITYLELRQMQQSQDLQLAECASEILTIVKKANQYKDEKDDRIFKLFSGGKTIGIKVPDLTKKTLEECINAIARQIKFRSFLETEAPYPTKKKASVFERDDGSFGMDLAKDESDESCQVCGVGFGPNPFHFAKLKIDEDIRKEEREKVIEEFESEFYRNFPENRLDCTEYYVIDKNIIKRIFKKLIRKE